MSFKIELTAGFVKSLKGLSKRHKSVKQDFIVLVESLKENPFQGVELAPGLRKLRMAISSKGKGKSGGARVITYTVVMSEFDGVVYLLEIYDKSDYDTVDIEILKSYIKDIP